ncbi:hypothetical protein ANN_18362 [Periplaneta americana]|uniref:Uncharacterized protein n=1 Tax=Periplaneta americana TaxID=6978 RepID=A0ABQ8SNK4_PERAM|nr:hypothetical protein ANN_18362 [Periplaneta americana]
MIHFRCRTRNRRQGLSQKRSEVGVGVGVGIVNCPKISLNLTSDNKKASFVRQLRPGDNESPFTIEQRIVTVPFAWPPRSPDLTTPDNALWEFIKNKVRNHCYNTRHNYEQLRKMPSTKLGNPTAFAQQNMSSRVPSLRRVIDDTDL